MARRFHSGGFADSWNRILCLGKAGAVAGSGSADMRCPPVDCAAARQAWGAGILLLPAVAETSHRLPKWWN